MEGRCCGPHCLRLITFRSPSPWFCSELCARAWLARERRAARITHRTLRH